MSDDREPEKSRPAVGEWRWVSVLKAGLGWVLGLLALAAVVLAVVAAIARP